jgi:hypothetical protein
LRCGESKTRCGGARSVSGLFRDHFMTKKNRLCLIAAVSINCDFCARSGAFSNEVAAGSREENASK